MLVETLLKLRWQVEPDEVQVTEDFAFTTAYEEDKFFVVVKVLRTGEIFGLQMSDTDIREIEQSVVYGLTEFGALRWAMALAIRASVP